MSSASNTSESPTNNSMAAAAKAEGLQAFKAGDHSRAASLFLRALDLGGEVHTLVWPCDLSKEADVDGLFGAIGLAYGRLDLYAARLLHNRQRQCCQRRCSHMFPADSISIASLRARTPCLYCLLPVPAQALQ